MNWKQEYKILLLIIGAFLGLYFMPLGAPRFDNAIFEALALAKWYTREHVLLCLIPAFFIAGAIAVFVAQDSVMKYLGAGANKVLAYGVASVSGSVLAVCSCTVMPLFAGIYRMGAGLGPASAFLYSGPAINVLAIILTARILGLELGIARAVGAIIFSIVIGLLMHLFFRKEEVGRAAVLAAVPTSDPKRTLWQNALFFFVLVAILIFATWGSPEGSTGLFALVYAAKWILVSLFAAGLGLILIGWFGVKWLRVVLVAAGVVVAALIAPGYPLVPFAVGVTGLSIVTALDKGEASGWFSSTWDFAKLILPLLLFGVLIAGFLLGRPGHEGIIPSAWVAWAVGGNSLWANLFASVAGGFMYFATLTEVPILQGLIGAGMGKGPALALLLAGPALSLPSMLVIRSVLGTKKTVVYVTLVVVMSTISGLIYGTFFS
ncbi:MAG: permease [Deltaproteobacteria bacterium]|nr:permease [Candidatus Zymogenaceae bacterium]